VTSGVGFHYAAIDRGAKHLHPLKYCLGLARAAANAGVTIFERSKVTMLAQTEGGVDITTDVGHVKAKKVVIACNGYLDTLFAPIAGNIMPINNFIVATEPLDDDLAARLNPLNASLSDSLFVINYWKLSRDRRLIFGGGETYSDQFPDSITDFVRPKLLAIYPELSTTKLDFGWGGTLAITRNRMPDLGVHNGAVFYAQGFSGHGVPTATMAGKLIALAINGGHEDFDLMAGLKTRKFPGGPLLRRPSLIAGMLFYSLRDRLGR
jgi:gamma-glutamylputrescine oxidase